MININFVIVYLFISVVFFLLFMCIWVLFTNYYHKDFYKLYAEKNILSLFFVILSFFIHVIGIFEMLLCYSNMTINHCLENDIISMVKVMLGYGFYSGLSVAFSLISLLRSGIVYFLSKKFIKLIESNKLDTDLLNSDSKRLK